MGREKRYASGAERQRAYRLRLRDAQHNSAPPATRRRPPSRPARLAAIQFELEQLHGEYEQWLAALPESLEDSDQALRLSETVEQLQAILDQLSDLQPPRGFGRD